MKHFESTNFILINFINKLLESSQPESVWKMTVLKLNITPVKRHLNRFYTPAKLQKVVAKFQFLTLDRFERIN